LWLTICVVLVTEVLVFVPSLAGARRNWLRQRINEAEIVALSAAATSPSAADDTEWDELVRLPGAAVIRLQEPGHAPLVLPPSAPWPQEVTDLRREGGWQRAGRALAALFPRSDHLILVEQPGRSRPDAMVSAVLHEHELDLYLREEARREGLLSLLLAVVTGGLVFVAVRALFVRPLHRITENISAFRADPEHGVPLVPEHVTPRDDEVAVASRELAAMQRELRAALWRNARLAALGAAVAKVSHDLRGILSPALLTAERLQMSKEPSVKRAGDVLVRAVERATDLVRRTLEFAREGPTPPARERLALRAVVDEAAELGRSACPGLNVANDVPKELDIEADRMAMVRVLGNLLRNAGEAGARMARVAAEVSESELTLTVEDDGPGLPEQVQRNLFRPFVTGGRKGSTGLGLAIVRDLMRAHGGDIVLESTGASGTIFRLRLSDTSARRPPPSQESAVA
jgi:signal transduction histidine kinase